MAWSLDSVWWDYLEVVGADEVQVAGTHTSSDPSLQSPFLCFLSITYHEVTSCSPPYSQHHDALPTTDCESTEQGMGAEAFNPESHGKDPFP